LIRDEPAANPPPRTTQPHGDKTRGTIPKGNRMKKYFIASVVAVMAFAFAAFAASLTVNAGTLQAGTDSNLKCADQVDLVWNTSNDWNGHWVGDVTLRFLDESGALTGACNGERANLAIFDAPTNPSDQIAMFVTDPISQGTVHVDFKSGELRVKDIELVQVLIGESATDQSYNFPAP
jgi:hypothetical protein